MLSARRRSYRPNNFSFFSLIFACTVASAAAEEMYVIEFLVRENNAIISHHIVVGPMCVKEPVGSGFILLGTR